MSRTWDNFKHWLKKADMVEDEKHLILPGSIPADVGDLDSRLDAKAELDRQAETDAARDEVIRKTELAKARAHEEDLVRRLYGTYGVDKIDPVLKRAYVDSP